jgi:hypothetical protein
MNDVRYGTMTRHIACTGKSACFPSRTFSLIHAPKYFWNHQRNYLPPISPSFHFLKYLTQSGLVHVLDMAPVFPLFQSPSYFEPILYNLCKICSSNIFPVSMSHFLCPPHASYAHLRHIVVRWRELVAMKYEVCANSFEAANTGEHSSASRNLHFMHNRATDPFNSYTHTPLVPIPLHIRIWPFCFLSSYCDYF